MQKAIAKAGNADAPTPQEYAARFVTAKAVLREQVLRGTGLPLAKLSDMRTLEGSYRMPLEKHFQAIFRQISPISCGH